MSGRNSNAEHRILTRAQAAAYCGLTISGFDVWVRKGIVPPPIAGTRRWDRNAIDAAFDRASGIEPAEPVDAFEAWEREQRAGKTQGRG